MKKSWAVIDRGILKHWVWSDKPFSKGQAWVDLLLTVNHSDNKIPFDGQIITVKRGSTITSIHKLSERWGWSTKKTSNFLNLLEKDEMVIQERNTRCTTLTIVKYNDYQNYNSTKETEKKQSGNTPETLGKTNNNNNNDNKIYIDHFDTFWSAYPKKVGKAAAQKSFSKLKVNDRLLDNMLSAINNQKQSKQWQDKQFIPNPATWLNQKRWEDELDVESSDEQIKIESDGAFQF